MLFPRSRIFLQYPGDLVVARRLAMWELILSNSYSPRTLTWNKLPATTSLPITVLSALQQLSKIRPPTRATSPLCRWTSAWKKYQKIKCCNWFRSYSVYVRSHIRRLRTVVNTQRQNIVNFFDVPVDGRSGRCGFNANDFGISLLPHLDVVLVLFKAAVHALGPKSSEISETIGSAIRLNEYVSDSTN